MNMFDIVCEGTFQIFSQYSRLLFKLFYSEFSHIDKGELTPRLHVNISCSQFQTSLTKQQNCLAHSSSAKPSYFFKHVFICFRRFLD